VSKVLQMGLIGLTIVICWLIISTLKPPEEVVMNWIGYINDVITVFSFMVVTVLSYVLLNRFYTWATKVVFYREDTVKNNENLWSL